MDRCEASHAADILRMWMSVCDGQELISDKTTGFRTWKFSVLQKVKRMYNLPIL